MMRKEAKIGVLLVQRLIRGQGAALLVSGGLLLLRLGALESQLLLRLPDLLCQGGVGLLLPDRAQLVPGQQHAGHHKHCQTGRKGVPAPAPFLLAAALSALSRLGFVCMLHIRTHLFSKE